MSLLELLVLCAVVALLAVAGWGVSQRVLTSARKAHSAANLRQFGVATHLYLGDHNQRFFRYREDLFDDSGAWTGIRWWFGEESRESNVELAEGLRELDRTASPLYPYLRQAGSVEICRGFDYNTDIWKPKYDGASYGYGYNVLLGGGWFRGGAARTLSELESTAQTLLFATSAQINTFQPPASRSNPMLEEFYGIDQSYRSIHFRFNGHALVLFVDGHVESRKMYPGTLDTRWPAAQVGRITPVGSTQYLQ